MKLREYYRKKTLPKFSESENFIAGGDVCTCEVSCAYQDISGINEDWAKISWGNEARDVLKVMFIKTMRNLEDYKRKVLLPVTEKEPILIELLKECPFVETILESPSRHGKYKAFIYVIDPQKDV